MKQKTMTTKDITIVGVMAALVFAATYFLKINMPLTMGYVHLGDSMIFLAVYLFGWKKGALAGAIGGAMSDLIGGYVIWIVPTFAIKFIMAMVAGLLFDLIKSKGKYLYIATYYLRTSKKYSFYSYSYLIEVFIKHYYHNHHLSHYLFYSIFFILINRCILVL